ncbi:hypothetical protein [Candidatus Enterococcus leclercqii]|uniref:hypothetical protein n=1 Tax=Candidatus Enterococcus leclercqii TaxID=1857218 RepID=UPI00137AC56D|nr:hypothetical protein [Enterococcus sp. CU9D]KAF1291060.1 hypothetical protein BAU14_10735 [Enterococcus sp. CU9D]
MSLRDDVLFSLEIHGDIEFYYKGQHYYIGYNNDDPDNPDNGYVILKSPNNQIAIGHSDDWSGALDEKIFDGKSMNDVFDELNFTLLI